MRASRLARIPAALLLAATLSAIAPISRPVEAQASAPGAVSQRQPDPFYVGLMRDGRTSLLRGDAPGAVRDLRLACFGFLDFPATLAECRIRLGLAQAALGDHDAFLESFSRLEDLEERFAVYAAAQVSPEERAAFEKKAVEWVSPEVLRSIPAFVSILELKQEADFARLAPRERTRELERRATADPANPRWSLELAEEDLARDEPAAALDRLAKLPDAAGEGAAGCLRGRALGELERCDKAVTPLAACAKSPVEPHLAELLLGCYVALDRPAEARSFAATLAPAVASRPEVRKRIGRIPAPPASPKPVSAASAKPASPLPAKPELSAKPPAAEPAKPAPAKARPRKEKPAADPGPKAAQAGEVSARPNAADRSAIADFRKAARKAEKREELERALALGQPLADRFPKEADLQLEVGVLGYRTGKWATGADFLSRPDGRAPSDPTLRFYLAVCQFEAGDAAAAARTASTGLEKLPRTPLVESYLKKILPAN